jgi:uncharacterized membrane protein YphA (DoxX/SURF4 family)
MSASTLPVERRISYSRELHYAIIFLRIALAVGYLSAVADRFGLWGPPGAPSVGWGNFHNFTVYTGKLNPWCPPAYLPALAWIATIAEGAIGFALLIGFRTRITAFLSGLMALAFTLAMTFTTGPHSVFSYSVLAVSAASFVLAALSTNRSCPA